jgi:hypothetical protein
MRPTAGCSTAPAGVRRKKHHARPASAAAPHAGPSPHASRFQAGNTTGRRPIHWIEGGKSAAPLARARIVSSDWRKPGASVNDRKPGPAKAYGCSTRKRTAASVAEAAAATARGCRRTPRPRQAYARATG